MALDICRVVEVQVHRPVTAKEKAAGFPRRLRISVSSGKA